MKSEMGEWTKLLKLMTLIEPKYPAPPRSQIPPVLR
jgi:hypothetical protein